VEAQIVKNIQADCANLANGLGFSWINAESFNGEPIEASDQAVKNANETDVDTSKARKFQLQNRGGYNGWWQDRFTKMQFDNWALEVSPPSTLRNLRLMLTFFSNLITFSGNPSSRRSSRVWYSAKRTRRKRTSKLARPLLFQ
jgi:hypothetical protein